MRGRMTDWVCDYCGEPGRRDRANLTEQVQCPDCGEPVTPVGS